MTIPNEKALQLTYGQQFRFAKIQEIIEQGNFPTAEELALALGYSVPTVRRDIRAMRYTMKHPIDSIPGGGYFYREKVAPVAVADVNESEVLALGFGMSGEKALAGTGIEKPFFSAFNKITVGIAQKVKARVSDFNQVVSFHTNFEPIMDPNVFQMSFNAAANLDQLRIYYIKPGPGQEAEWRTIDLYHLAHVNGEWYMMVFDHLRGKERTFIPARVLKIEKTGKKFVRPKGWSVEERLKDSFVIEQGDGRYDIVIRFNERAADYIRVKKWKGQTKMVELPNGHLELHMTLSSLNEVQRWIMTFNGNAFPIGPNPLCDMYYCAAEKMLSHRKGEGGVFS